MIVKIGENWNRWPWGSMMIMPISFMIPIHIFLEKNNRETNRIWEYRNTIEAGRKSGRTHFIFGN